MTPSCYLLCGFLIAHTASGLENATTVSPFVFTLIPGPHSAEGVSSYISDAMYWLNCKFYSAPKHQMPSLPMPALFRREQEEGTGKRQRKATEKEIKIVRGPWDHSSSIKVAIDVDSLLSPLSRAMVAVRGWQVWHKCDFWRRTSFVSFQSCLLLQIFQRSPSAQEHLTNVFMMLTIMTVTTFREISSLLRLHRGYSSRRTPWTSFQMSPHSPLSRPSQSVAVFLQFVDSWHLEN